MCFHATFLHVSRLIKGWLVSSPALLCYYLCVLMVVIVSMKQKKYFKQIRVISRSLDFQIGNVTCEMLWNLQCLDIYNALKSTMLWNLQRFEIYNALKSTFSCVYWQNDLFVIEASEIFGICRHLNSTTRNKSFENIELYTFSNSLVEINVIKDPSVYESICTNIVSS